MQNNIKSKPIKYCQNLNRIRKQNKLYTNIYMSSFLMWSMHLWWCKVLDHSRRCCWWWRLALFHKTSTRAPVNEPTMKLCSGKILAHWWCRCWRVLMKDRKGVSTHLERHLDTAAMDYWVQILVALKTRVAGCQVREWPLTTHLVALVYGGGT